MTPARQYPRCRAAGFLLALSVAAPLPAADSRPPPPLPPIAWPAFLRRHDMSFDSLPNGWREAPHFGNAMVGTITTDKGEIGIRHFVHAGDMAIVTDLTPSGGEKGYAWTWHPAEARTTRGGYRHARKADGMTKKSGMS